MLLVSLYKLVLLSSVPVMKTTNNMASSMARNRPMMKPKRPPQQTRKPPINDSFNRSVTLQSRNTTTKYPDVELDYSMTNLPNSTVTSLITASKNTTQPYDNDTLLFQPYTLTGAILTAIPVTIIIIIIVAGNALVITAVLKDPRLQRQVQNWLIVSLAVADALVGLLIMPLTLTYELLDKWVLGDFLCELWLALDVLFVTASILNLCAISLDRYFSLTDPTRYPQTRTPKRMLIMIMVVWLSAFAISFPPLVGWRPAERAPNGACFISNEPGYVTYSALGSFFIPVLVLLFVYARIYMITRKRSKSKSSKGTVFANGAATVNTPLRTAVVKDKSDSGNSSDKVADTVASNSMHVPCNGLARPSMALFAENDYALLVAKVRSVALTARSNSVVSDNFSMDSGVSSPEHENRALSIVASIANQAVMHSRTHGRREQDPLLASSLDLRKQLRQRQKLVRRRERQATLVLGLVLGAFIGSWLPFFSSYVLSAMGLETPALLFDIVFWLGYCNSGLNVFIYNFFNPDFRNAFKRILTAPIEKCRARNAVNRRRSSVGSALGTGAGRKTSRLEMLSLPSRRRGAVFSPKHPYLQVQEHEQQKKALVKSAYENLDE